jgi:hypothetical protein
MITTVLVAEAERTVDSVSELAVLLMNGLVGGPPDHVLTPANPRAAAVLTESDLVVVASPASAGALDARLRRELEQYRLGLTLAGVVAFPLIVGRWPADGDVVELQLKPLLRAAGATCAAPGLHVNRTLAASAVAAYCRYWRPAVPALVRLAKGPAASVPGPPARQTLTGRPRSDRRSG